MMVSVGGYGLSDEGREKKEAGRIGRAGFPSRRGIPSKILRAVFDRCGGTWMMKPTRGCWYAPIVWTPVGVERSLKPIAPFPCPVGRCGRTGCSPERGEVVTEGGTPQEGGGVGDGGCLSHGHLHQRGRVAAGAGHWVAYDAAVDSQDWRKQKIENRRWFDACFISSARSTAAQRDMGISQADNLIFPNNERACGGHRYRGSSWWCEKGEEDPRRGRR
jgi:hypothetical protein